MTKEMDEEILSELLLCESLVTRTEKSPSDTTVYVPIGQEASENDILRSFLTQKKVKVCAWKSHRAIQTKFRVSQSDAKRYQPQ